MEGGQVYAHTERIRRNMGGSINFGDVGAVAHRTSCIICNKHNTDGYGAWVRKDMMAVEVGKRRYLDINQFGAGLQIRAAASCSCPAEGKIGNL